MNKLNASGAHFSGLRKPADKKMDVPEKLNKECLGATLDGLDKKLAEVSARLLSLEEEFFGCDEVPSSDTESDDDYK